MWCRLSATVHPCSLQFKGSRRPAGLSCGPDGFCYSLPATAQRPSLGSAKPGREARLAACLLRLPPAVCTAERADAYREACTGAVPGAARRQGQGTPSTRHVQSARRMCAGAGGRADGPAASLGATPRRGTRFAPAGPVPDGRVSHSSCPRSSRSLLMQRGRSRSLRLRFLFVRSEENRHVQSENDCCGGRARVRRRGAGAGRGAREDPRGNPADEGELRKAHRDPGEAARRG